MNKNDIIQKINKLRLINYFILMFYGRFSLPLYTKLEGSIFTERELAIYMFIGNFAQIFQKYLSYLPIKRSLWLPVIMNILLTITAPLILFCVKCYLIYYIIVVSVAILLEENRDFLLLEYYKEDYDIQDFSNTKITYGAIGNLLGYLVCYIFTYFISDIRYLIIIAEFYALIHGLLMIKVNKMFIKHIYEG